ncbi:hypothetical protein C8R44DRAFT_846040 [Mycena epipterygia]|nr:hypothetical protein C8R44DRAFT_846040 [Mycena epipterygia]
MISCEAGPWRRMGMRPSDAGEACGVKRKRECSGNVQKCRNMKARASHGERLLRSSGLGRQADPVEYQLLGLCIHERAWALNGNGEHELRGGVRENGRRRSPARGRRKRLEAATDGRGVGGIGGIGVHIACMTSAEGGCRTESWRACVEGRGEGAQVKVRNPHMCSGGSTRRLILCIVTFKYAVMLCRGSGSHLLAFWGVLAASYPTLTHVYSSCVLFNSNNSTPHSLASLL